MTKPKPAEEEPGVPLTYWRPVPDTIPTENEAPGPSSEPTDEAPEPEPAPDKEAD